MSKKQICKWIVQCYKEVPTEIRITPIKSVALKLKELDEDMIRKPYELLNYIWNKHRFTQHKRYSCLYHFWLSASLFDNLRPEILQLDSFKKYKKLQRELVSSLYAEVKIRDWESQILKDLKKERRLMFKYVLIEAFNELGIYFPEKWNRRLTMKLLTLPDFEFIMLTSFYFSANFSKKLKHLLWSHYYRYLKSRNPLCHTAKAKLKKVINLEALDKII